MSESITYQYVVFTPACDVQRISGVNSDVIGWYDLSADIPTSYGIIPNMKPPLVNLHVNSSSFATICLRRYS